MANVAFQANETPYLTFVPGASPGPAPSGQLLLFNDVADGLWKSVDDVSVVTPISTGSTMTVLTADPGSPADDTAWLFRDGGSPENVELHVRRAGVTKIIPLGTLS